MSKEGKKKAKKEASSFAKDFKAFITRGNVVDMAVAVIIGAAFSAIVTGLVNYIINPVISIFTGGIDLDNFKTVLKEAVMEDGKVVKAEVAILWGKWIQAIISFLIVALVLFLLIRTVTKATGKLRRRELEEAAAAAEKKKEEEKVKAAAAAAAKAEKAAKLQQFYDNVEKQTKLLEEIAKK